MLIDETHRPWLVATIVMMAVATALYIPYHLYWPNGPSGGSWPGLIYGIVGYAMMLFAGALSVRKKWRIMRVGRAQAWMRGHLWLGLISFPIILFHAGFKFGGALSSLLMWLFIIVIVSGVFGAVMQHFLPRLMTMQVPTETIYEQVADVRAKLREEADRIVEALCAPVEGRAPKHASAAPAPSTGGTVILAPVGAAVLEVEEAGAHRLREFYDSEVVPYLENPDFVGSAMAEAKRSEAIFRQMRTLLPAEFHEAIADLESICEEERDLTRQVKLHHWLHGWLLMHLPLSFALLLLGAVHAVMALAY